MGNLSRLLRPRLAAALVIAALAVPAASVDAARTPPAIRAKQAQAQAVIAQINAIDEQLGRAIEQWDGAKYKLGRIRGQLASSQAALAVAKRQHTIAVGHVIERLVQLYTTHAPSTLDVVVGATSLSSAIDAANAADALAAQDHELAVQTARTRDRMARIEKRLAAAKRTQAATVAALGRQRAQIEGQLASRQHLLASVQSEIAVMKRKEAERQRELAAAARARLQRELAARAAAQRAAQQRAQQIAARQAAAQQAQALEQQTQTVSETDPGQTTPGQPPTDTAATTTPAPPVAPAPLGGGHPEAAAIALRYLGVPYVWGGASPAGFDCSGLVMYVFAQLGISLPHYAAAQYNYGTPVPRDQLQPGDLVFFDGLGHVGIYIGNGEMVHAPHTGDVVKISPLSEFGANYVGARRI